VDRNESTAEEPSLAEPPGGVVRRILTYAPSSLAPAALTMVTSVVFTRIFSTEAFGLYSLFLVMATAAKLVATTWLSQGMAKYLPVAATLTRREEMKQGLLVSLTIMVILESLVGLLTFAVAYPLLNVDQRGFLLPTLVFVLAVSLFEIVGNVFPTEHRAKEYTSYKLLDSVLTFVLRLLLVSSIVRMDIRLMLWSVAISNLVLIPSMWMRSGLPSPLSVPRMWRSAAARRTTRSFLVFGFPMTLWLFSSILLDVGDRYVINFYLGPGPVGIYDVNYKLIAGSAALLVVPITMTLHPYLMGLSAGDSSPMVGKVIGSVVENLTVVGALAVGLTAVFHHDIAAIMLGEEFREGSVVMPVVLAGVFFFNIGTFAHKPFEISGRTRPMVIFGAASAVVNLLACFVLIPVMGYLGAAYGTLLAYLFYTVGVGALGRGIIWWRISWKRTMVQIAGIVVGVVAMLQIREILVTALPYWWGLGVAVVVAVLAGGAVLLGVVRRGVA
jgi:O-antigen/teichoic acid export membrane protein